MDSGTWTVIGRGRDVVSATVAVLTCPAVMLLLAAATGAVSGTNSGARVPKRDSDSALAAISRLLGRSSRGARKAPPGGWAFRLAVERTRSVPTAARCQRGQRVGAIVVLVFCSNVWLLGRSFQGSQDNNSVPRG